MFFFFFLVFGGEEGWMSGWERGSMGLCVALGLNGLTGGVGFVSHLRGGRDDRLECCE